MACSHSGIVDAAERRARAMLERTYFRKQRLPTDAEQHAVTALLDVAAQAIAARAAA